MLIIKYVFFLFRQFGKYFPTVWQLFPTVWQVSKNVFLQFGKCFPTVWQHQNNRKKLYIWSEKINVTYNLIVDIFNMNKIHEETSRFKILIFKYLGYFPTVWQLY